MSNRDHHDQGDEDRSFDLYCRNCGDPYDMPSADDPSFAETFRLCRQCPNPTPGRPLVDCGIGGHMYADLKSRCS
jgi:hypothetical protein